MAFVENQLFINLHECPSLIHITTSFPSGYALEILCIEGHYMIHLIGNYIWISFNEN